MDAMADFQPQGQNWSGQDPRIGTGEGEAPLAKPPVADLTMRTLNSDIASMKAAGGGEPRPYVPKEVSFVPPTPESVAPQPMAPVSSPTTPAAPAEINFGDIAPAVTTAPAPVPAKSSNALFITLTTIIIVAGLAAVGYFFIYPQFSAAPAAVEQPAATEQPAVPPPAPAPEVPAATLPAPTELPTVPTHASLLKTPADFATETTLGTLLLDAVKGALASPSSETPMLKEVTIKNAAGNAYAWAALAPLFMPHTFTADTLANFSPDATILTYTDKTGTWPAIVLQFTGKVSATTNVSALSNLEQGQEYTSLFLTDPGTPTTWKDGKVGGVLARYVAFSKPGLAFSYTWLGTKVVLSSSYAGAQEIAKRIK